MEGILDSASTSAAWLRYTGQAVYNAAFQAYRIGFVSLCEPSSIREKLPQRLQAVLSALKWFPPVPGVISPCLSPGLSCAQVPGALRCPPRAHSLLPAAVIP